MQRTPNTEFQVPAPAPPRSGGSRRLAAAGLLLVAGVLALTRLRAQGTPSEVQLLDRIFDSTNRALRVKAVATGGGGGPAADNPNLAQVFNRAYDSTNTALKVNCVAGCQAIPSFAAPTHQFLSGFTSPSTFTAARPAYLDLTGVPATLMNYQGAWNSSTTYNPNDVVTNGGSAWVALLTNTNVTPVAGATWTQIGGGGGGGSATTTQYFELDHCGPGQTTNPGNSFFTTTSLTWEAPHWEMVKNTAADIFCSIRIPHTVASTPNASIVLVLAANDGTAGHTDSFTTSDAMATTSINPSLTSASAQNYTTTSTAYAPVTLTFAVQSTVAADNMLIVQIHQAASNSVTNNVFVWPYLKIDVTE